MHEAHAHPSQITDHSVVHRELIERRRRLEAAAARSDAGQLVELLDAVDDALGRIEQGDFGICEACDAPIERDLLINDPLARICLDCLSASQRRALEHDLSLASSIQRRLLPVQEFDVDGWEGYYHYEPHGAVSGDFCDVIRAGDETLVLLGDISGKGVSAALLMSHLSAIFRGLSDSGAPLVSIMERANRLFSAAIPAGSFATLVAARLLPDGEVELSNAGHVPPIVQNGRIDQLPPDGVPLGLFCQSTYTSQRIRLEIGDRLVLVTDGLVESTDGNSAEYGIDALASLVQSHPNDGPCDLARRLVTDADRFRNGRPADDDTTLMVVRRTGPKPQTS
jgi:sigma-B regulation protein RsbU (phosphoserine phosphatase)